MSSGGGAAFLAGNGVEPGDVTELAKVRVGRHHGETVLASQSCQVRVGDQISRRLDIIDDLAEQLLVA
jgi:hypothetical protein